MGVMKFFRDIITIVVKNFKLLIRSKSSGLVVIFGPLIIVLLLGMAFNTSGVYNINVGVFSLAYSELTDSVVDQLRDERYNVIKHSSEDICRDSVKTGDSHICLIFPENMAISNERTNNITFYVDYSRINLVYAVMDSISRKLSVKSEQLSLEMTQILVDKLNEAKSELTAKETTMNALISDNEDALSKAGSGYDKITGLQLTKNLTDLNITEIDKEVDSLEERYNTTFTDLNELLDKFKENVNAIFTDFKKVEEVKTQLSSDLDSLKTTLGKSKESINAVKGSMDKIIGGISSIPVTKAESIVSPFKTEIKPVTAEKTHLGNMFPSMIVLVVVFISVLLASTMVIRERKAKAYFRNFITPTNDITFLIGDFITNLILVLVQLGIVFAVAAYFFKGEILGVLVNIIGVLFLIITLFVLLGMVLGYVFNNQETSTLGAMFVSSVLLFFSNTILPLETLPSGIKDIAMYNPFVVSEGLLRELILFNVGLSQVLDSILVLLGFVVVFALLLIILRFMKKREL